MDMIQNSCDQPPTQYLATHNCLWRST